jgi:hypothetical protein
MENVFAYGGEVLQAQAAYQSSCAMYFRTDLIEATE